MIKQACILAGGRGMRLQERTKNLPKALMPIGCLTMLDYILIHLARHGIEHVVVAGGYLVDALISQGFNQPRHGLSLELVDTGLVADTGGRIKAVQSRLGAEAFLLCWCDALSDLDFSALVAQHRNSDALVTLAAVHPPPRYGDLQISGKKVVDYAEKARQINRWISGGYFVVEPEVVDSIDSPNTSWERDVLTRLTQQGQLDAYQHWGEWQCMDTLHELKLLQQLQNSGGAFWPQAMEEN